MTRQTTVTTGREAPGEPYSRRQALALMFGASPGLAAPAGVAEDRVPMRVSFSESLVAEVNLNDARAAMQVYCSRVSQEMNIRVEVCKAVFETITEIHSRLRTGSLDAVALTAVEYRQVAQWLDSSRVLCGTGPAGIQHYVLLVKQNGTIKKMADLRGSRLIALRSHQMCVAPAWLSTLLDEGRHGPTEQFFGSVVMEPKAARVILPVFFGQADACLTTRSHFETMCELNPQVASPG